jgi:hypothetical protein
VDVREKLNRAASYGAVGEKRNSIANKVLSSSRNVNDLDHDFSTEL